MNKISFTLLTALISGHAAIAQNRPVVTQDVCIGPAVSMVQTWIMDLQQLPGRNFFTAGFTSLNGNNMNVPGHHNSGTTSGFDGFVTYSDNTGNVIWHRFLGGSRNDEITAFTLLPGGEILAAGQATSPDGDVHGYRPGLMPAYGNTTTPAYDGFVAKLNLSGDTAWTRTYGTYGEEKITGITATLDGNYIFCGSTDSTGEHAHGWTPHYYTDYRGRLRASDGWIVKIKPDGDTLWTRTIGGNHNDVFTKIIATSDSGYLAIGQTFSTNLTNTFGSSDAWIVKLDKTGNTQWQKVYGGSNVEELKDVIELKDQSGFAIVGHTKSADIDAQNYHGGGQPDIWLLILDQSGTQQLSLCYGGTKMDVPGNIVEAPEGGFLISGIITSRDGDVTSVHNPPGADQDGWVIKVNAAGVLLWDRNVGGHGADHGGAGIRLQQDGTMIGYVCQSYSSGTGDVSCSNSNGTGWVFWLSACPSYTYEAKQICNGESYTFDNNVLNTSGVYWQKLTQTNGCDSLIQLTLTVESIDKPVVAASGNTLSTSIYTSYQWLREDNTPISGAVLQTYVAATAGAYKVAVTNEYGCSDTSVVFNHTPSGIAETAALAAISIYPNPAAAKVYIAIPELSTGASVTVSGTDGKVLLHHTHDAAGVSELSLAQLPAGIYFVKITCGEGTVVRKLIKE